MSERELETVRRTRDRIRDLLRDYIVDMEDCRTIAQGPHGDPNLVRVLTDDIAEVQSALEHTALGIFEELELWMDVIEAKGI